MGEKINIGGLEIEVASQDEINEKSDAGDMVFACMPIKFGPSCVPGSREMHCDGCKQKVWMSPETYFTWQSADAPIMCLECVTKGIQKDNFEYKKYPVCKKKEGYFVEGMDETFPTQEAVKEFIDKELPHF